MGGPHRSNLENSTYPEIPVEVRAFRTPRRQLLRRHGLRLGQVLTPARRRLLRPWCGGYAGFLDGIWKAEKRRQYEYNNASSADIDGIFRTGIAVFRIPVYQCVIFPYRYFPYVKFERFLQNTLTSGNSLGSPAISEKFRNLFYDK